MVDEVGGGGGVGSPNKMIQTGSLILIGGISPIIICYVILQFQKMNRKREVISA